MVLTLSSAEQRDLLQNLTFSEHDVTLRDNQAPLPSGESTDNAIWISDGDSSDTEDDGDVEDHDLNTSQPAYTTPTTASVTSHSNGMCTKQGETESDAAICMGVTEVSSPARRESVRILSHEPQMGLSLDLESNQQGLHSMTYPRTGGTMAGADTDSDIPSVGPEVQSGLDASDGEFVSKASGAASELDVMTDVISDEESCHRLQAAPMTLSELTSDSFAPAAEMESQTPEHNSDKRSSAERDATSAIRSPSPRLELLPKPQRVQDQDYGTGSLNDAESNPLEAGRESLSPVQTSPVSNKGPFQRISSQISPHPNKNLDAIDMEDSDSEGNSDVKDCIHVDEYSPSLSDASGEDSEDDYEVLRGRKRRRVSCSSRSSAHGTPVSSRYEEWPLSNVCLQRITEGEKTTFQLQFNWTPDSSQAHCGRSVSHHKGHKVFSKAPPSRTRSISQKWTPAEDEKVRLMKQDGCSWAEIQRVLPHRSQGSIQVRYSTKLRYGC